MNNMKNNKVHHSEQIKAHAFFIWKSFLKDRWHIYLLGVISVLLTNLMQILTPKNIGWIIDFFAGKSVPIYLLGISKWDTFLNLFFVMAISRVLINIFRFMWRITLGRQTHYAAAKLRREVWENARFFKKDSLESKFTKGVLMSASASDSLSARFIFGFTLVGIADVFFLGIFCFIAMAQIHFPMAILAFLTLTFLPTFVKKLSKREMEQYHHIQNALSRFNDLSSQAISTIKLQRLTQTGRFWERKLMDVAEGHRLQRLKGVSLSLLYIPVMGGAVIASYLVLFAVGIYLVSHQKMSVGDFMAMQGLMFLLHDPLMSLGFIISEWKKAFTALERLAEIYQNEKEHFFTQDENKVNLIKLKEEDFKMNSETPILEARSLTFSHRADVKLISDFNLQLTKGERLGIVGPIGSGKSTLIEILMGIERNIYGEILFLGKSFQCYSHEELRKHVVHVNQRPFIFADTIKANVTLDSKLSDEETLKFLDIAGLREEVQSLPNGIKSQLGEWGINLSGGQKQRLTLARALARKPKILFLDDCLSAVDTLTEEKILKNLNSYLKDVTIVWVAHRQSTLKYCDKILKLNPQH